MSADLRPKWLNLTRSLQKAACRNAGLAVVSLTALVDAGGDPVTWTEPDVTRLGPLSSQSDVLKLLAASSSVARHETDYMIAQVIDGRRLVVNKGENALIQPFDYFAYVQDGKIYVILSVDEIRPLITILTSRWVSPESPKIKNGDPLYKLSW